MTRYAFYTADVFTSRRFGGNQLAVLPDARGMDEAAMMTVAREFNFSESVFVLPPDNPAHTRRLRIFTPAAEMPFAGHPTVGTAFILASIGAIELAEDLTHIIFEEGVGPVPVSIRAVDGEPVFAQLSAARMPEVGPTPPARAELAAVLGLREEDLLDSEYSPQAISCGVPFLFIPVRSRADLARIRVDHKLWQSLLGDWWAREMFVFAFDPELPGSDLRARMFAPALGIPEDPATGAAATALPGYLAPRSGKSHGTLRWTVEQGFEMGRPSILEVEADLLDGQVEAIRVGGASVMVSEGYISV